MVSKLRSNRILTCLENGEIPLGLEINSANPAIIEILGHAGMDCLMLDKEHTRINPETLDHCIRAADSVGITTIVRVSENNPAEISQAIDAGAQGIIVPHVNSKEDVQRAARAMRYSPEGDLGACPGIRPAGYSMDGWDNYVEHHNRTTMLIPLLEDMEAIDNAEEIFSELKIGTDAIGMGLGDLAQSIVKPGENVNWSHPDVLAAREKVINISKQTGVPLMNDSMATPSIENAKKNIEEGARICIYEMDLTLFYNLCNDIVKGLKGKG